MLMPKRVKHRKVMRGRMSGMAKGGTAIAFDGDTGAVKAYLSASNEPSGFTVSKWLYWLHMAQVFGLPMQIFVCAMGLVITALSITGVYIWWKKRRARKSAARTVSNPRLAQAEVSAR